MINLVKRTLVFLFPLASLCALAHSQDLPAVTGPLSSQGFSLPDTAGTLRFSLTGTEGLRTGYSATQSSVWNTAISGDFAYLSESTVRPFSMVYSGGYLYNTVGQPNSIFQNLDISQALSTQFWNFVVSDTVSYIPESPSGGLSGIPGLGDVGINPPPSNPDGGQDILSNYAQRVSNTVTVQVERKLTGSTSLDGTGTYFIQRFLTTDGGIDINEISGEGGITHRINALNDVSGSYTYSRFAYPAVANFSFTSQSLKFHYSRQLMRRLKLTVGAGPEFSNTDPIMSGAFVQPGNSQIDFAVDSGLTYANDLTSYSINYTRGVRGGSGIVPGTESDSVIIEASHKIGPSLHLSADTAYTHIQTLAILTANQTSVQSVIGNFQASRIFAENFSAYLSYSLQKQIVDGSGLTVNAFNGLSNVATVGITYSPRALHVGHK